MAYQAEISRENPACILFVIDQSGSMDEITETGRSKADFVADVLNKTLYTLVTSCSKSDGVRNYFDVGVIAYGGSEVASVRRRPVRRHRASDQRHQRAHASHRRAPKEGGRR